jgi:large repetitive protein
LPPVITSTPPTPAYAGLPYTYQVHGVSPENYPFIFSLDGTPPSGMSITPAGLLTWDDPAAPDPTITIDVTDNQGGEGVPQTFTLPVVAAPGAGTITFQPPPPPSEIQLGRTYQYQALATDTYNYTITYSATGSEPSGLTVDPSGLLIWDTTDAQLETYTLYIQASDEYGDSTTLSFSVQVVSQQSDQPPTITSSPPLYAVVGDQYGYALTATDPGGFPMTWTLDYGPTGMVLDPSTNTLLWTPTADEAGYQPVSVTVGDSNGGWATQSFRIDTLAADSPPRFIDFTPPVLAGVDTPYAYQVEATDDDGSPVAYLPLATSPDNPNITIDPSGLITWADPGPADTVETITVTAQDFAGLTATETYTLTVQTAAPGTPPVFNPPWPPAVASVGYAYPYTPSVTYTPGDNLTYAIDSTPALPPGELGINSTTGAIDWTPSAGDVNLAQPISITITAIDNTIGQDAFLTFPVTVTTDTPPTISGMPPMTIAAGLTYFYQFQSTGATGFDLLAAPAGMSVDASGLVTWTTGIPDIGDHEVKIEAVNAEGLTSAPIDYTLSVVADTTAPTVQIEISSNPVDINTVVYFDVIASDDVGVTSLTLTVGGAPVALSPDGEGQYTTPGTYGPLDVLATAGDAAGNVGTATATLEVVDPTDNQAPTVAIASPLDQAVITAPVEVTGTVSDQNILSWTLAEAPFDGTTYTTIASGTSTVDDGDLGLFDPTTLANGPYTLLLTAWNAGGYVSTTSITVNVSGYLKLGNLHLSFTDLTVPVSGIPITITRTYDSLNANRMGDFGYGWTLSEQDYQLQVDTVSNGLSGFGDDPPFENGTRVLITKPDGTVEGFSFEPIAVTDWLGELMWYTPAFVPDAGVTDTLKVPTAQLELAFGSEYISGDGTEYNRPTPSLATLTRCRISAESRRRSRPTPAR